MALSGRSCARDMDLMQRMKQCVQVEMFACGSLMKMQGQAFHCTETCIL